MSSNDEFKDMSPLERKVAKLSIKYHADLMSMPMHEVRELISAEDYSELHDFMKNGCRDRVLH